MKKSFLIINLLLLFFTILNIMYINHRTKDYVYEYSYMIANKITKYIVNNAYVREKVNYYASDIYDIVKDDANEIKNIIYDSGVINDLINSIGDRVYNMFSMIESGDMRKIKVNANILTNKRNDNDGIILEVPSGLLFNNYLFSNLGPKMPVKISLNGDFESFISSEVKEYGINNAMVTIYINIRVSEQITLPFITDRVVVENKIPIFMSLVNGTIPNYYFGGFNKNSNIY